MRIIITMTAIVLPMMPLVRKYVGTPIAAAVPKQISCLFVRLKMTLLFTFVKSLGTVTYAIIKNHLQSAKPKIYAITSTVQPFPIHLYRCVLLMFTVFPLSSIPNAV